MRRLSVRKRGPTPVVLGMYRFRTFGDSRATLYGGTGPNVFAGGHKDLRAGAANQPSAHANIPMFMPDAVFVADGGASGDVSTNWNSGARLNGRTLAAVMAIAADATFIQIGTNDVQQSVTDAATATSVATTVVNATQAMIAGILAAKAPAEYVFWETVMQRDAALGYLNTAAVNKRDCVDSINTQMLAWITAQANPKLISVDTRALTNVGDVTTGAYAKYPSILGDGIHVGHNGGLLVGQALAAAARAVLPSRGLQNFLRATGPNLLQSITPGPVSFTASTANGTVNSSSTGVDAQGRPYAEVLFTPTTATGGRTTIEIRADVGSSGGTAANTVTAGDKIAADMFVTLDNGSGGVPSASILAAYLYTAYTDATPLDQFNNGAIADSTGAGVPMALIDARLSTMPVAIAGGSAQIAAGSAAGGAGMRLLMFVYGSAIGVQIRLRLTSPQIRKVV